MSEEKEFKPKELSKYWLHKFLYDLKDPNGFNLDELIEKWEGILATYE